ncbi:hypothetical protein PROFUN_01188 [Planoprotostelium fungivorum]|uniref:Uncharacterized protein n=1 Tax=Planoprotostelium fungivorum TaxID=1890364 RepID=A0A2P6NCI8_9EUKA|nr:hypothetical protein PROFUN_01188 [Planoprotostelium fungivorum]
MQFKDCGKTPSSSFNRLPALKCSLFFGTLGDDFYKKLNSRSNLAQILGPNVAYKPCLLATPPPKY